ncbi:nuclear transport factor 2 family protein [Viridibacillus sp. YIM B01967]|uniref:Nuclear transport factor 2 family protein n=1 Tax=Viridibacillus soli TaxID=2798301 RepID=A0ABS1HD52_9BACL|nr:nuclear transport factor 2 family protein [Viridibacillus soli]MBK3497393.1 nuclear transport factor 2 family protein [Viridibacillus soli]
MDEKQIVEYEEMLRKAMLTSDVKALEELINDNLIFVNHFGQILTKAADNEVHRLGVLKFTEIKVLDQKVLLLDTVALTVKRVALKGVVDVESIEGEMCYTRVWQNDDGVIKIISGHCSSVS